MNNSHCPTNASTGQAGDARVIRPNLAVPMNETEYATNIRNRLLDIGFNIEDETKLYEEPIEFIAWR
jgi:hypothetical protein